MSRADVNNLAHGACSSAASGHRWSNMDAKDLEWAANQTAESDRLYRVLACASRMQSAGSMVVTSDDYEARPPYYVEVRSNVRGWHDEDDITRGLPIAVKEDS
jgi:hypothetical protein